MEPGKTYTVEEARKLFYNAADAAEAMLPSSVASKLTHHLREVAGGDFDSGIGQMIAHAWLQCAIDLVDMPSTNGETR